MCQIHWLLFKSWAPEKHSTRRYHTVSLSADLECHSLINNPGQLPSLLHSSLPMSGQWPADRLSGKGTRWPWMLDDAWCSSGITPWWVAGNLLTPASSFMEAQKHQSWWISPDAHTPQHSIFMCCFTFPQTIKFPGSRGFGGESWLPSPVKKESLLGSGSHSPQACPTSCKSPSTPLLSIDCPSNSTSVSISRTKTLHKRDLGLEQSFYFRLLTTCTGGKHLVIETIPDVKMAWESGFRMLQFAKDLGHCGGITFWMTLRRQGPDGRLSHLPPTVSTFCSCNSDCAYC